MNEIKWKEEQVNHLMPVGTSQTSLFSSDFPSKDDKRSWFFSSFPLVSSNYGRPSSSSADIGQCPQSFMKEKTTQTRCNLTENESLDLKCKKPQRILFDLELPANEYMNDETEAQGEFAVSKTESYIFNKSNEVTQDGEKKLSNHTYTGKTYTLADLNEPVEVEEVSASASVDNLGNEISRGISTVHLKTEKNEKECSSYTFEAGNDLFLFYFIFFLLYFHLDPIGFEDLVFWVVQVVLVRQFTGLPFKLLCINLFAFSFRSNQKQEFFQWDIPS